MFKAFSHPELEGDGASASDRLDTWKEIAAYLKRDVRTVHRWEKEEGLPVRRHRHHRLSTVFAYRSELDEWWKRRDGVREQDHTGSFPWKSTVLALGLLCLFAISFTWMPQWYSLVDRPWASGAERPWVLISDFENRTGNALLDGTVEYALHLQLSSSQLVQVVSRPRIEDTLRLMKKPLDTPISVRIGREVCVRDGGIGAMVAGGIEKMDGTYQLSLRVIDPFNRWPEENFVGTVKGEGEIPQGITRMSDWLLQSLREVFPRLAPPPERLERVTTPSLKALRLFTLQDQLFRRERKEAGLGVLKAAIAEDPEFATAYAWLAYALLQTGRPHQEVLDSVQRAKDLCKGVSEWERYHILGAYYELNGDFERALPHWEALCERYPDDFWGNVHLQVAYAQTGRSRELTELALSTAERRPNDYLSNWQAAAASGRIDPFAENPFLKQCRFLSTQQIQETYPSMWAMVELYEGTRAWIEGQPAQVIAVLDGGLRNIDLLPITARNALGAQAAHQYLRVGKIEAAERLTDGLWGTLRSLILSEISLAGGRALDPEEADAHYLAGIALARNGKVSRAQELLAQMRPAMLPDDARFGTFEGEIALARGDVENAVTLLSESLQSYSEVPLFWTRKEYFLGAESLATALRARGQSGEAARVLEDVLDPEVTSRYPEAGFVTLNMRWLLARTYQDLGQLDRSKGEIEKLKHQLQFADPDHPILVDMQRSGLGEAPARRFAASY